MKPTIVYHDSQGLAIAFLHDSKGLKTEDSHETKVLGLETDPNPQARILGIFGGLGLETTMTTDKNNFLVPAGNCPPTQTAAQLRGDKKDVVFTSCSSCFQLTYRQVVSNHQKCCDGPRTPPAPWYAARCVADARDARPYHAALRGSGLDLWWRLHRNRPAVGFSPTARAIAVQPMSKINQRLGAVASSG